MPTISAEQAAQRMQALNKANLRRQQKKAIRLAIESGLINDLDLLKGDSDYEEMVKEWPLLRVLKLMRQIGEARAYEVCAHGNVTPRRTLASLSFEKRGELAHLVREAREGWKP